MPVNIIKNSLDYCLKSKSFLIFLLILMVVSQIITDSIDSQVIGPMIMMMIIMGYGLQVTEDIIHGGTTLPKIMPKKFIEYGIKGFIILIFYLFIQISILGIVSLFLNFPDFEMEDIVLHYSNTIQLFIHHDPISFTIFIISGFIIVYVTTFFMELALARLADKGQLRNAFRFRRIKHAIDIIGWKNYAIDYTKIIIIILILTYLIEQPISNEIIDLLRDFICYFLIFVTEFIGIGNVYKVYIDSKKETSKSTNN